MCDPFNKGVKQIGTNREISRKGEVFFNYLFKTQAKEELQIENILINKQECESIVMDTNKIGLDGTESKIYCFIFQL